MPSITPERRKKCEAKHQHTKKSALTARNYEKERHGKILRCYPCPVCGHWHLTSKGEGI